jgi:hypothetical protein
MNNFLIARATSNANVKMVRLNNIDEKPFFLNCGSRTVKSYLEHPTKKGVSLIKVSQNKIIVALGNLLRVYSFDLDIAA